MKNLLNQNDVICFKNIQQMSSFDWKKNIEDSINDGLIITATTAGIFAAIKVAKKKPPKESLDAMDIVKLAGGICGGILVKIMHSTRNGSTGDATKILLPTKSNKLNFLTLGKFPTRGFPF